MKKTIYNVYVDISNDFELYLRLIKICENFGLQVDKLEDRPKDESIMFKTFHCNNGNVFGDWSVSFTHQSQVTEQEFIELLKEYKNGK